MSATDSGKKSLGVAACTAIVVGNMVGSGFYLSPAAVAPYGNLAIVAWIVMGVGAICLGLTFAKLARLAPATGGPYAYTRMAYGDFAGFWIAWGYWISIWASLPVIAIAFAGAVMNVYPALHNRTMAVVFTIGAIWAVVFVNLRGVKAAGVFSEIMTYSKLVPFAAIALIGLLYIDPSHFSDFNPSGESLFTASAALAPLTMFAYFGLESATVPAGDVTNPETHHPDVRRSSASPSRRCCMCSAPWRSSAWCRTTSSSSSVAPFSDAARVLWGPWGATAISLAVIAFLDWRAQRLDAADGPSADGRGPGWLVPAAFRPAVSGGSTGNRHHRVGRVRHRAGAGPGGRLAGILGVLQSGRRSEHDGCGHSLCVLRACQRAGRGARGRRRADSASRRSSS